MKTYTYVIAGSMKKDGKLCRVGGIAEVTAPTEFEAEMAALKSLPVECFAHRSGRHVPECWPLESAEGTKLALAAGLIKSQKALV